MTIRAGARRVANGAITISVVAAATMAGCGVTKDAHYRPVRVVPFSLADSTTTSTSTIAPTTLAPTTTTTEAPTTTAATYPATIYLVDGNGHLRAVDRALPTPATDAKSLLPILATGAIASDGAGLRSLVTAAVFSSADTQGGAAIVQIGPGYGDLDATQAALATAQVVFTVTELRGVGRVRLKSGDDIVGAMRPDGSQATDDVSRDDYRGLLASG